MKLTHFLVNESAWVLNFNILCLRINYIMAQNKNKFSYYVQNRVLVNDMSVSFGEFYATFNAIRSINWGNLHNSAPKICQIKQLTPLE